LFNKVVVTRYSVFLEIGSWRRERSTDETDDSPLYDGSPMKQPTPVSSARTFRQASDASKA
jgi:hypothetical protein